jgi:predicted enzyme related to lactoylglutathione lyase
MNAFGSSAEMSPMPDSVVHFEIPVDNMARAQKFYKETFGWSINAMPEMGYAILGTAINNEEGRPTQPGAINGGMLKREDPVKHTVVTIKVGSIDEAEKRIQKNGGKMIRKKLPVGDMGFAAYFQDSEGNVVGLWETKSQ